MLAVDSLTPDTAAIISAEEPAASLLHVCLHPCLSNALKLNDCTFNVHFETYLVIILYDAAKYYTLFEKKDNNHKIIANMKCIRLSICLSYVYRRVN